MPLKGFERFGGCANKKRCQPFFVSFLSCNGLLQVSKSLIDEIGLDKKRFYADLYYNKRTKTVAVKFLEKPGKMPVVAIRRYKSEDGRHTYIGAAITVRKFCRFYGISYKNQTKLPVKLNRRNKTIIVKLRRK